MVARLQGSVRWRTLAPVVVVVALALAGVGVWHYLNRPSPLAAEELRALVSEHTAAGRWTNGQPYLLYFAADGSALYREPEIATQQATWRIGEAAQLCVAVATKPESCQAVAREAGNLVWILPGSGRTYSFTLAPGRDPGL